MKYDSLASSLVRFVSSTFGLYAFTWDLPGKLFEEGGLEDCEKLWRTSFVMRVYLPYSSWKSFIVISGRQNYCDFSFMIYSKAFLSAKSILIATFSLKLLGYCWASLIYFLDFLALIIYGLDGIFRVVSILVDKFWASLLGFENLLVIDDAEKGLLGKLAE